jgi:hypothetical protein
MEDGNNPAPAGNAEPLTFRGAVNQLVGERRQEPEAPATPPPQAPVEDAPDPADLEALEASEETDAPEQEQPQRYRLKDGSEATLDEIEDWRKGTLRQQDYTRKTQELAAQRQQQAAQWQAFQQNQAQYAQAIDQAISILQHRLPQPPSDELRKQDFFAWQEKKADYDAEIGKLQSLHHQRQQLAYAEQQKQRQGYARHLQREQQALLAARPELRDPARAVKFSEDVKKYAVNKGYRPEDVSRIADHRLLSVVSDAMQWQKLQAQKAKLSEKAKDAQPMPPVQAPGRRQSSSERTGVALKSLEQRLDEATSAKSQIAAGAALLQARRDARR